MTLLENIKNRLGVFYSEANKDAEIQQMINGAKEYYKGAGWDFTALLFLKTEKENLVNDLKISEAEALIQYEAEEITEEEYLIIKNALDIAELELLAIDVEVSLPVEAIVLYGKMAQSTDPSQLTNHPVLISFIAQNRGETDV